MIIFIERFDCRFELGDIVIRRNLIRCLLVTFVMASGLLAAPSLNGAGAATSRPIIVGDICSCTGAEASSVAPTTPTLQAWASYVNSHGGIQGHPVTLIIKEDAANPSVSLTDAKALVLQDHAVALFDNSQVDVAWASFAEQNHIPVVGGTAGTLGYTNPDFFANGLTEDGGPAVFAHLIKMAHATKVADLYCAEVVSCQQSIARETKAGIKFAYTTAISYSAPSYAAQCLAAKQSGSTLMIIADASTIITNVATQCAAQGYKPTELVGNAEWAISMLSVPAMEGTIGYVQDLPWFVHNSATKPMYQALAKYAPSVTSGSGFGEAVIVAWAAGVELESAAKAAHLSAKPTAQEITAGFYALPSGTTFGGLAGPITYKKGQVNPQHCYFTMKIHDGKFVALKNAKPSCV